VAKTANLLTFILLSLAAPAAGFAASQIITFDAIPNQILGVPPFPIMAQASSGLPVSFASTTPGVCKNAGSLVMLLSAGPCFITASQAGNGTYSAATSVTRSFMVSLAKPSGTLTASSGSPFAVGASPEAVVVGDFNGDGIPDLATANSGDNTITVLLGNSFGGFAAAAGSPFAVGTSPQSLVVGDFNGDGIQDLAVANSGSGNVTVLLADGFGGFVVAAGSPFTVGTNPESLAAGDFNGDGIQDLATASASGVSVLLGNGRGGFTATTGSPVLTGAVRWIVVADFNGDGIQDLAADGLVLLGNGAGGFTAAGSSAPGSSGPTAMVVGDFNGDGIPDLAVASVSVCTYFCFYFGEYSSNVTVFLGNGAGGFTAVGEYSVSSSKGGQAVAITSLVVGDFNGDGVPDLVAAVGPDAKVLLGDGLGGLTPAGTYTSSGGPFAAGDFSGDGLLDLAVANAGGVSVLLGGIDSTTSLLGTTSPLTITVGQPVSLTVTVSDTTAAFDAPTGNVTFFDGVTVLGIASQSVGPYAFTVPSPALGLHTLTAIYSGDLRSSGSSSNTIAIQVYQAQTITFAMLSNVGYGVPPFTIGATSSSGLAVSFASATPSVCTVSGTTVTIVAVGTCSITASQAGNATYEAAVEVTQSFIASNDQLATSEFPSGSGSITLNPPSSGNYYAYGSIVCVTAIPPRVISLPGGPGLR
jgi:hypothetical protein